MNVSKNVSCHHKETVEKWFGARVGTPKSGFVVARCVGPPDYFSLACICAQQQQQMILIIPNLFTYHIPYQTLILRVLVLFK